MIHLSSYHSNGLPTVVWSNKVNLIGEKVYKPKIHFCEHCNKPILIYGRLIPCKHVFCFTCATLCLTQQQSNRPSLINIDESTSNTTPTTIQQDTCIDSPNINAGPVANGSSPQLNANNVGKGCHRCGGKALRVERNTLNSIFVCQVETCRRTYLSARDLQAHVKHRHSESKSGHQLGTTSASLAAISSSPYISSSSLMHLNSHNTSSSSNNHNHHHHHHQRQSTTSMNHPNNHNNNSPSYPQHHSHHNRHDRDSHHGRNANRDRDRFGDRDSFQRDRERERDSKEYHRQSLQRAAQWAEASAQIMEKGLTR